MTRLLLAALILTGCTTTTTGTPIEEPQQLHCDLIFPAPLPGRT